MKLKLKFKLVDVKGFSTAFASMGFYFFKPPSWKGAIFNLLPMCVQICDLMAFWWAAATLSRETKLCYFYKRHVSSHTQALL